MDSNIAQLSSFVVPVISILFSYYLGVISQKKGFSRKIQKERYVKAYVPYITRLYKGFAFDQLNKNSLEKFDYRTIFFELINDNLQYWGNNTLSIYHDFYVGYLDMLEHMDGNEDFVAAPDEFHFVMNKITLSILEEATKLEDELSLPRLTGQLLTNYRESMSELRKSRPQ